MYPNKYLIQLITYFLPKQAQILNMNDEMIPAILEGDINGDKEAEVTGLYKLEESYYLIILKRSKGRWGIIYNNKLECKGVTYFKIARLEEKQNKVAIGIKESDREEKSKLLLLGWKNNQMIGIEGEKLSFDKLYVQDIDGKDGLDEIVIWKHKALEAYDVELYRLREGRLVLDSSLDKDYFSVMVNYYTYLCEVEEDPLYTRYLEEAKRRCIGEAVIENDVEEKIKEKPIEERGDLLEITEGYIKMVGREMTIGLWGQKEWEKGESVITQAQLILSEEGTSNYEMIPIGVKRFEKYQLFIGDFTGNGLEDIWIGTREGEDTQVSIYSYIGNGLVEIWNTEHVKEELEINKFQAVYPVDSLLKGVYGIHTEVKRDEYEEELIVWEWQRTHMEINKKYRVDKREEIWKN